MTSLIAGEDTRARRARPDTIARLKIVHARPNVFTVTATAQELSALIAAGRMSVAAMEKDPHAPTEALELLRSVLQDYDRALARLRQQDGRSSRPSGDSR